MTEPTAEQPTFERLPVLGLAAFSVALHLAANAADTYGIFRDEYYYLACANRLAWGYVDQPPLSILLLAIQRAVLGDSLFAIRVLPALLGGATVLAGGLLAREFGGRRFAQTFAALLLCAVPGYLGAFGYYSMNSVDVFVWSFAVLLVARLANGADRHLWLVLGLLLGLGLLNKVSVLWLGAGLFLGVTLTPLRRHLAGPWPWLAGGVAGVLALPYALWQARNGWPTIEFVRNAALEKNIAFDPGSFLIGVAMEINPLLVLFWIAGLAGLLFARHLRAQRWAAWCWLAVLAILVASGTAKPYYANASFPALYAAGAVVTERVARRWARALVVVYTAAAMLFVLPFALPVLSPASFVAYSQAVGVAPKQQERSALGALPQFFADRFGWRQLAREVSRIYHSLPGDEQREAVIYTTNYGRAAALEYYAGEYDLPPVLSGHNSYWFWGPGSASGKVVLVVDDEPEESLLESFEEVATAGAKRCEWCMPFESDVPIRICRRLRGRFEEEWPRVRRFI